MVILVIGQLQVGIQALKAIYGVNVNGTTEYKISAGSAVSLTSSIAMLCKIQ